jgi:hypothetical protein
MFSEPLPSNDMGIYIQTQSSYDWRGTCKEKYVSNKERESEKGNRIKDDIERKNEGT